MGSVYSFGVSKIVRWLVRFRIRVARPIARGRKRLIVGPSSACAALTTRSSPTSSWLCSALATADSSSLLQSRAIALGVTARIARASSTDLPRMWSHTSRALRALERTYFACARTTGAGSPGCRPPRPRRRRGVEAARAVSSATGVSSTLSELSAAGASSASSELSAAGASSASSLARSSSVSATAPASSSPCGGVALASSAGGEVASSGDDDACGLSVLAVVSGGGAAASASADADTACSASADDDTVSGCFSGSSAIALTPLPGPRMPAIQPRRRELPELVPHHRLRDEHGHVLAPVMDGDRVPDHLGKDRRRARPGADHALLARAVHRLDAAHQPLLDERPLLAGTTHRFLPLLRPRTMYWSDFLPCLRVR